MFPKQTARSRWQAGCDQKGYLKIRLDTLCLLHNTSVFLFSVLSYFSYHTLFGVSILVTTYLEYSKQTLLCNTHNASNLILRYPFCKRGKIRAGKREQEIRNCLRFAPYWKKTNQTCNPIGSNGNVSTLINSIQKQHVSDNSLKENELITIFLYSPIVTNFQSPVILGQLLNKNRERISMCLLNGCL